MFRKSLVAAALSLSLASLGACTDRSGDSPRPASKPAADNTAVNERDRNEPTVTPTDQQENETDLRISQSIRQAVVNDDSLSFNAKNIKIVTSGAVVTLRGPVKSEEEKQAIEAKARQVAGVTRVDNQIQIEGAQ